MTAARKDSAVLRWVREKFVEVFGADLRSLAAFRIVLALLVLADLANRTTDLYAHYTDEGVLPRTVLLGELLSRWAFSLNLMNGEPFFQVLVFGVATLAALGLLVGYRTRLMTVVVWVLLLSIQWRNPLILNSGDVLLRMLLFWAMFLPLGAYLSVDRALKGAPFRVSMRFLSLGTVALFMQIAFVYWFTAMLKSGPEWRVEGTAIYYALGNDQFATHIGAYLHQFPELLKALTFATIGLEAFGPFLLFFPFFTGPVRTAAALAFMNLQFGIWLTMDVGLFSWTAALCMICFLPSWFWDTLGKLRDAFPALSNMAGSLQGAASRLVHAYWLPLWTRLSAMTGAQQPSFAGMAGQGDELGSYAGRVISPLSTITKTWRGELRPVAGPTTEPEMQHGSAAGDEPPMLRPSLVVNLLALLFLAYVFFSNLGTVSSFTMPERIEPLGPFFGIDQQWSMFAPYPPKDDTWHVIPGNLRGGQQVNLLPITNGDFDLHKMSWEKPPYVRDIYKNERWRKYLENIDNEEHTNQRLYFGRYICGEWNARHSGAEQLMTFEIAYVYQQMLPDYRNTTPQKVILWEHSCF